jgi:hypothetical protein
MSPAVFQATAEALIPGLELIDFSFSGEPLLNPNVYDMVHWAKQRRIGTVIHTNGRLLDSVTIGRLIDCAPDIVVVNLNALSQGDRVTEPEDVDAEYRHALESYIRAARDTPTFIVCQVIAFGDSSPRLHHLARSLPAAQNCVVHCVRDFRDPRRKRAGQRTCRECYRLFQELAVGPDGQPMLCCADNALQAPIGRTSPQGLLNVWREGMNAARSDRLTPLVADCGVDMGGIRLLANAVLSPLLAYRLYRRLGGISTRG